MYELKHRWRYGMTHVVFDPMELLGRLAALVPAPRFNLIRYHGVLVPAARWRRLIVPSAPATKSAGPQPIPLARRAGNPSQPSLETTHGRSG